ncbi:MAG: hypothetical protein ABL882_05830 [Sphingopyxis sp.]
MTRSRQAGHIFLSVRDLRVDKCSISLEITLSQVGIDPVSAQAKVCYNITLLSRGTSDKYQEVYTRACAKAVAPDMPLSYTLRGAV